MTLDFSPQRPNHFPGCPCEACQDRWGEPRDVRPAHKDERTPEADKVYNALRRADSLFPVNDDAATVKENSEYRKGKKIRDRFVEFHLKNPRVYEALVKQSRILKDASDLEQVGIDFIHARVRWLSYVETDSPEPFKLSNDFRPEYARLIMVQEPDLRGFFKIRSLFRKM